jgi:CRISPR/Cas system-associated endonuclease Cas1
MNKKQVELRQLAQQILVDEITSTTMKDVRHYWNTHDHIADSLMYSMQARETRKAEDKLWLCISYGIGLFVAGYGLYQFIRFIIEGFTLK